jgi:hypothetical protein
LKEIPQPKPFAGVDEVVRLIVIGYDIEFPVPLTIVPFKTAADKLLILVIFLEESNTNALLASATPILVTST